MAVLLRLVASRVKSRTMGTKTVTGEERIIGPGFRKKVYAKVKKIPRGKVSTYGDVAGSLGSRRIARQVGFALAALDDDTVPWHRVINAQGRISFKGDLARAGTQRKLLEAEGIEFDVTERVVDFDAHRAKLPAPRK